MGGCHPVTVGADSRTGRCRSALPGPTPQRKITRINKFILFCKVEKGQVDFPPGDPFVSFRQDVRVLPTSRPPAPLVPTKGVVSGVQGVGETRGLDARTQVFSSRPSPLTLRQPSVLPGPGRQETGSRSRWDVRGGLFRCSRVHLLNSQGGSFGHYTTGKVPVSGEVEVASTLPRWALSRRPVSSHALRNRC